MPEPSDDPFADIDPNDPQAVARALAEVGMRVGARQSTLEHLHRRVGRALTALEEATKAVVTREDLEDRMAAMEQAQAQQRASDRRTLAAIFAAFVLVVVAAFVAVAIAVAGNTAARHRQQDFLNTVLVRQEIVAICTRTEPDEQRIRSCVANHVAAEGVPSHP